MTILNIRYVRCNSATDGLLSGPPAGYTEADFPVYACLRRLEEAGRAAVRHYDDNPKASTGWHIKTTCGKWLPLAIRHHYTREARNQFLGSDLVAHVR
jgi:hypothetical protein